jgi:lysozyme
MHAVKRKPTQVRRTPAKRTFSKKKKKTNKPLIIVISALLILAVGIIVYTQEEDKEIHQAAEEILIHLPKGFKSSGMDVSHHQGYIEWSKIVNTTPFDTLIDFVYCKATEGSTHIDREWESNRKQLNELGIRNGAYHFLNPNSFSIPQAKHFLATWKHREIDLPPVLDVETEAKTDKLLINNMYDWLEFVERKSGFRPIIYTSYSFYVNKFKNEFKDYQFWIASYDKDPKALSDKRIVHWQFTDNITLPGISEKVDFNVSKRKF